MAMVEIELDHWSQWMKFEGGNRALGITFSEVVLTNIRKHTPMRQYYKEVYLIGHNGLRSVI